MLGMLLLYHGIRISSKRTGVAREALRELHENQGDN